MARILITGASGLLGSNLAVVAAPEHQAQGIYRQHPLQIPGVEMVAADLADQAQAGRAIAAYAPEWVVHCAAASEVDRCELDPAWARRLNVDMAKNVAEAAHEVGARLAHVSTDAVFDGEVGDYRESDEPRPIMTYGVTKLAGEEAVAQAHPEALILRINLFGWGPGPKRSLAEWFLDRLEVGDSCPGFTDVYFSPLLAQELARAILDLLEIGANGLYHLPGRTCLSKYEFGVQLAQQFELDPARIRPMRVGEAKLTAARPKRLCLNGEKVESVLGRRLPELESGLRELRESRGMLPSRRQARAGTAA